MKESLRKTLLLLALFAGLLVQTGCITDEPPNTASRPWNSPRGWESGIPSSINQGK